MVDLVVQLTDLKLPSRAVCIQRAVIWYHTARQRSVPSSIVPLPSTRTSIRSVRILHTLSTRMAVRVLHTHMVVRVR